MHYFLSQFESRAEKFNQYYLSIKVTLYSILRTEDLCTRVNIKLLNNVFKNVYVYGCNCLSHNYSYSKLKFLQEWEKLLPVSFKAIFMDKKVKILVWSLIYRRDSSVRNTHLNLLPEILSLVMFTSRGNYYVAVLTLLVYTTQLRTLLVHNT